MVVESTSEVAGRFEPGARLWAVGGVVAAPRLLTVATSRPQGELFLLTFEGQQSRDGVEALRGVSLEIDATTAAATPPPGRFWIHQLIGCRCEDEREGPLGEVVDVIEDGGGELLIVEGDGREIPIPFVAELVPTVDIDARRVVTRLPEGLLEACGSVS